ncbi:ATP-dependent zinc metalloprotease FTSH 7 [Forsythia ovata]|uniref:ATP-dependent zinc metalloprotease FTSH 7 n=1 Tax=Forsythia ovata TaxID=205694 RepID=A0ABD1RJS8_9LAMI
MATIEPFPPIIHRQFSMYTYNNPNYLYRYSFFCNQYRALHAKPCRLVHNSASFRLQPRVSKFHLWGGFLLNSHQRYFDFTKIYANSSCEHDTDSTDKAESKGQENKKSTGSSPGSGRKEKQGKNNWWWLKGNNRWRWQPIIQAQEIGVLLIQLAIVMFVMRLLRPGIPLPGSEPRTSTTFVSVPYSEFLNKINSNQVQKVEVDGVHIMFKLKKDAINAGSVESIGELNSKLQDSDSLLRSVNPTKRIVYTTTRPSDIKTPYEKMVENDVEFGSPDKRSGGFLNSALRLGVRVPTLLISPWVDKGTVIHEPSGPTPYSQYEHSSIPATVKKLFNLRSNFLTKRDAWAGTFENYFYLRDTPRDDCPEKLPEVKMTLRPRGPKEDVSLTEFQIELIQLASQLNGDHVLNTYPDIGKTMTVGEANRYAEDAVERFLEAGRMALLAGANESALVTMRPSLTTRTSGDESSVASNQNSA